MNRNDGMQDIADVYAQLPLSAYDKLRLLRLQGGQFDAPLVGTHAVDNMSDNSGKRNYDALSYT